MKLSYQKIQVNIKCMYCFSLAYYNGLDINTFSLVNASESQKPKLNRYKYPHLLCIL